MRWYSGEELLPFLRGAPFVDVTDGRLMITRLNPSDTTVYPVGAWNHALSTAGVRLVFFTSATQITLRAWDPGHEPEEEAVVSVWLNDTRVASSNQRNPGGEIRIEFALPADGAQTVTLYLPYVTRLEPIVLGVPDGHALSRVDPAPNVWAAYGDSITQGRTATEPGMTYVAQAARQAGVEPLNLGFRGWARGEPGVAKSLAAMRFDVLSILMGVNVRVSPWLDAPAWRETFRNFIELVRIGSSNHANSSHQHSELPRRRSRIPRPMRGASRWLRSVKQNMRSSCNARPTAIPTSTSSTAPPSSAPTTHPSLQMAYIPATPA